MAEWIPHWLEAEGEPGAWRQSIETEIAAGAWLAVLPRRGREVDTPAAVVLAAALTRLAGV